MTDIILKLIFLVFLVCMVGIAAGALLAVIDTVKNPEPEINEKKTLSACTSCWMLPSACLICRKRKSCIDSVQAHKTTDECFESECEQK